MIDQQYEMVISTIIGFELQKRDSNLHENTIVQSRGFLFQHNIKKLHIWYETLLKFLVNHDYTLFHSFHSETTTTTIQWLQLSFQQQLNQLLGRLSLETFVQKGLNVWTKCATKIKRRVTYCGYCKITIKVKEGQNIFGNQRS